MKRLGETPVWMQHSVSIVATLTLPLMIDYEVFARYVLKSSLIGIEKLVLFPIIWLYILGDVSASYEKSYIECKILTLYIRKECSKLIFDTVEHILCIIIPARICYWGFHLFSYFLKIWKLADVTCAPLFFADIASIVGFVPMFIYAVRDAYMACRALTGQMKDKNKTRGGGEDL